MIGIGNDSKLIDNDMYMILYQARTMNTYSPTAWIHLKGQIKIAFLFQTVKEKECNNHLCWKSLLFG